MNLFLLTMGIFAVVILAVALLSHTTDPEIVNEMES